MNAADSQIDYGSANNEHSRDYLTIYIAEQIFGIPVLQVQDVLRSQQVTRIPLAPKEVAGSLNLRGRIVTAINVRSKLGLPISNDDSHDMSVVVEHDDELYSLVIDKVGDVLSLKQDAFEKTPATLNPLWRDISLGIHQMQSELLIIMDVPKLIDSVHV